MAEPPEPVRRRDAEVDDVDRRVHAGEGTRAGVVLSAANPKNLILAAGAGATIAEAGLSGSDDAVVVILFVLVASVTIAGAVLVYLFGGEKAQHVLDGWKAWLGEHNAAVMTVLLVVIGSVLSARASTSSTEAASHVARASRSRARPRPRAC